MQDARRRKPIGVRQETRGRGAKVLLATALAAAALAASVAVVYAIPSAKFLHVHTNLSMTPDRMSAYPDLAVSPDGEWVAVAWVDGYDAAAGYRGHVYLRAASESGGWGNRIAVYTGTSSACAYLRASVAITGTTAYVAYVTFENSCGNPNTTRLRYRTCSLTNGTCGNAEVITSTTTPGYQITWADLALDANGNPHVVWTLYYNTTEAGQIFYGNRVGGNWGTREAVDTEGKNNYPAIAWADGFAHVVWEKESAYDIVYRRRTAAGVWGDAFTIYNDTSGNYAPHWPDVAAGAQGLFVVWDACYDMINQQCDNTAAEHAVLYRRSNDNGANWPPSPLYREVGTDAWANVTQSYAPTGMETLLHLRPSLTLNRDGWPAVAWHAGYGGSTYALYYSDAVSGTSDSVQWITPTRLVAGQLGAPAVGVINARGEGRQYLHFAYMQGSGADWDVYYNSNETYNTLYLPLVMRDYYP